MGTIPPPIRSIELRDRLSELLKQALQARHQAAPLYLLRSFGHVTGVQTKAEINRETLIETAEGIFGTVGIRVSGEVVIEELVAAQLLRAVTLKGGVTRLAPGDELQGEFSTAISRIDAYCRALEILSWRQTRLASPIERALREAACLFNEGLFFEVHEVLEAVWLTQEEGIRLLLQGLIQIAVGFHHLENNNLRGAVLLLQEGVEKVKRYGPDRSGVELDQFLGQVEHAWRSIESLGEAAFDRFDRRMIPQMPFIRNTLSDVRPAG